ncbi:MAG: hypothetical protein AAF456_05810 [Planctomycetota bacterium]
MTRTISPFFLLVAALSATLIGCSSSDSTLPEPEQAVSQPAVEIPILAEPVQRTEVRLPPVDVKVLFLGNSHTAYNNVPGRVETLFESSGDRQMETRHIAGGFLDNIAARPTTMEEIRSGKWDVLVLQGQKISMSGRYLYSTEAAEQLALAANENGMQVIWFSEWGRDGVDGESIRIQAIYESLAANSEHDIVAPAGLVWDAALSENKNLALYASDGNHSNADGATLAALVLYVAITGEGVDDITWPGDENTDQEKWEILKRSTVGAASHLIIPASKDPRSRDSEQN